MTIRGELHGISPARKAPRKSRALPCSRLHMRRCTVNDRPVPYHRHFQVTAPIPQTLSHRRTRPTRQHQLTTTPRRRPLQVITTPQAQRLPLGQRSPTALQHRRPTGSSRGTAPLLLQPRATAHRRSLRPQVTVPALLQRLVRTGNRVAMVLHRLQGLRRHSTVLLLQRVATDSR